MYIIPSCIFHLEEYTLIVFITAREVSRHIEKNESKAVHQREYAPNYSYKKRTNLI